MTMSLDYIKARNRLFPCCDDVAIGGCSERNKTRRRWICEQRCHARNAWLDEHQPGWNQDEHFYRRPANEKPRDETAT